MDEFERGLSEARDKLDGFSTKMSNVGKNISNAGSALTKGVTLPIVGLGTAVIKTGMDYEAGMSKVQAISGATGAEMDKLGEKAMEMAAKTKFSTADSAEAYQYMAMAGWKASDMVEGLAGIMNLAAASGENLGTTSDIVTDALTAFGLKAADSGRFADVLAAASNNANTNVSMLGESFKYVAPVAGAMGYSVEDVSVALGLMANSGIKASQAGTSLRTAITNMASPTKNMAAVMDKYGISLTDASGNMLSLSEIMGVLREKMGGLDESTQASAASALFGKEAMSGMLAIINAAPEDFNKLTDAIETSSDTFVKTKDGSIIPMSEALQKGIKWTEEYRGTTEKMAATMQDNAAGAFERMKSAIDVLFTKLSEHLLPIFTNVVEKITDAVNWFGNLDEGTQKLIITVAGLAAVVGPVLVGVGKVISAISTIVGAISSIGGAIGNVVGFVTSGIGGILSIGGKLMAGVKALFALVLAHPIVAAIAAVIAIIAVLWTNCEEFRNFFIGLWEGLKEAVSNFVEWFKGAWDGIGEFFSNLWEGVKETFSALGEWIAEKASEIVEFFKEAWNGLIEFFGKLWEGIKEVFSGVAEFFGEVFTAAVEAISTAWTAIVEFFQGVWEAIQGVFSTVAEVLGGLFQSAAEAVQATWSAVVEFFAGVWQGIQEIFAVVAEVLGGLFQAAAEAVQSAWSTVVEFFQGVWEGIKNVFAVVAEVLGGFFLAAVDAIKAAWDGITEFFSGVWQAIQEVFSTVAEVLGGFFQAAAEAVQAAWEGVVDFFSSVWEGIKSSVADVHEAIGNAFDEARKRVENAFNNVESFFKNVISRIVGVFNGIKSKFATIGKNIVGGIKNGITAAWGALKETVGNLVSGLVDGVKGLLGIASPSKVFAGIGKYMADGLGQGWDNEFGGIKRQIESGLNFGTTTIGLNTRYGAQEAALSAHNAPSGTTVNIYSPVAVDPVQAAREWKKTTQRMAIGYV